MKKENWIWMPHAGHLCVARDCQFHLCTYVGGYIVSTVGEYWPDSQVRKISAECRNIHIVGRGDDWDRDYMNKIGFEEIGLNRKYETMVFKARRTEDKCCPWRMADASELDFDSYNTPEDAAAGHNKLCMKWSKK